MRHKRAAALSALASGVILAAGWGAMLVRTADAVHTAAGSSTGPTTATGTAVPAPSGGSSGAPSAPSAGTFTDGAFTGDAVSTPYGIVQVAVTVAGGEVTGVQALRLPDADGHSRQLSNRAEPVLQAAALRAQSASIQNVSGATYTSRGYERSLQSALDAAAGR